jgi:GAF domain-containing protein
MSDVVTPFAVRLQMSGLMQTATDLSSEPNLRDMMRKILNSVVKASGADYCALLITNGSPPTEKLRVAICLTNNRVEFIEEGDDTQLVVPWTVINYVARTKEDIVNDVDYLGTAKTDPFLLQVQPKSILVYPLLNQARLDGVVYLHSKSVEAFRPERESVIRILAMQASSSLQRARALEALDEANTQLAELRATSEAHLTNLEQSFETGITE